MNDIKKTVISYLTVHFIDWLKKDCEIPFRTFCEEQRFGIFSEEVTKEICRYFDLIEASEDCKRLSDDDIIKMQEGEDNAND